MDFSGPSLEPSSVSSMRLPARRPSPLWQAEVESEPELLTRELRTHIAEHHDRLKPATAGLFAGAAGGVFMIATADKVFQGHAGAFDLVHFVGRLVSNGALDGARAQAAGFAACAIVGSLIGVLFAVITHHLRKFVPLVVWSVVFFPAMWTLLHAFVLPHTVPWLATMLPFAPMAIGAAVYGFFFALELPLRKSKQPRTLIVVEDED